MNINLFNDIERSLTRKIYVGDRILMQLFVSTEVSELFNFIIFM